MSRRLPPESSATGPRQEARVPVTEVRQAIAESRKRVQNDAAVLTTFNDIDVGALLALQRRHRDRIAMRNGVGLSVMPFFVLAATVALKEFPLLNARVDGDDIVHRHYFDICVAIQTRQGQVAPVISEADRLSITQIEQRIASFVEAGEAGGLSLSALSGGTFTIADEGNSGALLSTPLVNGRQSAILALHKTVERHGVVKGRIEARPMMYTALSYDHRIIDGKEAVSFLTRIKQLIEDPAGLILE